MNTNMNKLKLLMMVGAVALVSLMSTVPAAIAAGGDARAPKAGEIMTVERAEGLRAAGQLPRFFNATEFYRAGEFSIDLFGTAQVADLGSLNDLNDHEAGVGIGLNYFYTRNLGVSYELRGQARNLRHEFLNESSLSLVYRIPIGTIAPYGFAGGGYEIVDGKIDFNAHAGAGLEVRLSPHVGVFSDVRVITESFRSASGYLGRAGVRVSF